MIAVLATYRVASWRNGRGRGVTTACLGIAIIWVFLHTDKNLKIFSTKEWTAVVLQLGAVVFLLVILLVMLPLLWFCALVK